jgi:radical SAM superfamily enzyme YgiQ (UPF0313 family)
MPGKVEFRLARGVQEAIGFNPHILGISCFSQDFDDAVKICNQARASVPYIIFGGFHITAFPQTLPENADIGVIGEGEITFGEILSLLAEKGEINMKDLSGIQGIVYWDEDGNFIVNPPRQAVKDLDLLPEPDKRFGLSEGQWPYLFTSRGCPYKCSFCASSRYWQGVRYHSAQRVVGEIENILSQFPNIKNVQFQDDLFIANRKRFREIVEIVYSKGLSDRVGFSSQVRANLVNDEFCGMLRKMNLRSVAFGAESGSEDILKKLKDKNSSVSINQRALDSLKRHEISCTCGFVLGHYEETEEDLIKTYNFILDNYASGNLAGHDITVLTPMPGTPLWEWAVANGFVLGEGFKWSNLRYLAAYSNNVGDLYGWINLRERNGSIYLNERNLPIKHLYQIIKYYEGKIRRGNYSKEGYKPIAAEKLYSKYYSLRDALLPLGSKRRNIVKKMRILLWVVNRQNIGKSISYIREYGFVALLHKVREKARSAVK